MRQYIALAADSVRNDTIVFVLQARDAAHARQMVEDYYADQDWHPGPTRIVTKAVKTACAIQCIGHAQEEYQDLERQITTLCEKVLQQADGADLTVERDSLYEFVRQFSLGAEAIEHWRSV